MGCFCLPNMLMELKDDACLKALKHCQHVLKGSLEGQKDLLSPLPSYSCSFFQSRFPPGALPLPEQQVAETLTDPRNSLWVRRTPLEMRGFSISPTREGDQVL